MASQQLTEQELFTVLEKIFPSQQGFEVKSSKEGVYRIETEEHEGFNGEQIQQVFAQTKLYLSQIFVGTSGWGKGQSMLLLDLNVVDSHTGFYGYKPDGDKAKGSCRICGKQTSVCNHKYAVATQFIRNCNVCEWHDFCSKCGKETHGGDMCQGDLCLTCYRKENGGE